MGCVAVSFVVAFPWFVSRAGDEEPGVGGMIGLVVDADDPAADGGQNGRGHHGAVTGLAVDPYLALRDLRRPSG